MSELGNVIELRMVCLEASCVDELDEVILGDGRLLTSMMKTYTNWFFHGIIVKDFIDGGLPEVKFACDD